MPFKSKAQIGKMKELEKSGKVPPGTVDRWLKETPKGKLPERVKPKDTK